MPEITFPEKHTYHFDRDVIEFPAVVDGKTVACKITLEEMMREYQRGTPATFEDEFHSLRPRIEQRAKELILAKREMN